MKEEICYKFLRWNTWWRNTYKANAEEGKEDSTEKIR